MSIPPCKPSPAKESQRQAQVQPPVTPALDTDRTPDIRVALQNLSDVHKRMSSLRSFLSESISCHTVVGKNQMTMVSDQIASVIEDIILNGTTLLTCSSTQTSPQSNPVIPDLAPQSDPSGSECLDPEQKGGKKQLQKVVEGLKADELEDEELKDEDDGEDCEEDSEIVEPDAMALMAELIHFCEICGKGFKRDANLRMHMRAHGNQFKTPEALAKPSDGSTGESARIGKGARFSCPFVGCNRNKANKKFRPLKSVVCVRNHFKRSHCPKMYSCNRCNKKSFSVLSDLRSHLKHCGESKWKCSCGTTFSRKDKLFRHMALFEGHMPAVAENEEEKMNLTGAMEGEENEAFKERQFACANFDPRDCLHNNNGNGSLEAFFDDIDGFGSIENYCLQDVLGFSHNDHDLDGVY